MKDDIASTVFYTDYYPMPITIIFEHLSNSKCHNATNLSHAWFIISSSPQGKTYVQWSVVLVCLDLLFCFQIFLLVFLCYQQNAVTKIHRPNSGLNCIFLVHIKCSEICVWGQGCLTGGRWATCSLRRVYISSCLAPFLPLLWLQQQPESLGSPSLLQLPSSQGARHWGSSRSWGWDWAVWEVGAMVGIWCSSAGKGIVSMWSGGS